MDEPLVLGNPSSASTKALEVSMKSADGLILNDGLWKVNAVASALRAGTPDRMIQPSSGEPRTFRELHGVMEGYQKKYIYEKAQIQAKEPEIQRYVHASTQIQNANAKLTREEYTSTIVAGVMLGLGMIGVTFSETSKLAIGQRVAARVVLLVSALGVELLGHGAYFYGKRKWFEQKKLQLEQQWPTLEVLDCPLALEVIENRT